MSSCQSHLISSRIYTTFAADSDLGLSLLYSAGYPPFSGANPDETWANLKNWSQVLTRPIYTNPKDLIFNMGDEAWDAITR